MVSRMLALPAVVCVAAAAVLGVWGWGGRGESRARAAVEHEDEEEEGLYGDLGSESGPPGFDPFATACSALTAAADLRPPVPLAGPGPLAEDGPGPSSSTLAPSPTETGWAITSVLHPETVQGLGPLDRPEVVAAMEAERFAIERALAEGRDPLADPEVRAAAADLEARLREVC